MVEDINVTPELFVEELLRDKDVNVEGWVDHLLSSPSDIQAVSF